VGKYWAAVLEGPCVRWFTFRDSRWLQAGNAGQLRASERCLRERTSACRQHIIHQILNSHLLQS